MFTGYNVCIPDAFSPLPSDSRVRDRTRVPRIFSTNVKTREPRVTRSMQRTYAITGPDGWTDPVAAPAYLLHRTAAASRPRSSGQRLDLPVSDPIVPYNHVSFFTFFHSPRHCRRPIAGFRASFFPSLPEVQLTLAWNLKISITFITRVP